MSDSVTQFVNEQVKHYQYAASSSGKARGSSANGGLFDLDEQLFNYQQNRLASARSRSSKKGDSKKKTQLWKDWDTKAKRSGKRNTVYSTNGDKYTGEWEDDMKTGKGIYVWANGDKYEGFWHEDMRHGDGTLWLSDDNVLRKVYTGSWKFDMKHGWGTFFFSNQGDVYEGEWAENYRNGWGTMKYANGDKYEGEWVDDQRCGQGTYIHVNGDRYEGTWLNDMKEGTGTFLYINDRRRYDGEWHEDIARCGIYAELKEQMLEDGTIVGQQDHSLPELGLAERDEVLLGEIEKVRQLRESKAMYESETDGQSQSQYGYEDDEEEEWEE